MELIDLVSSVIIFSISNNLTPMVNLPTRITDCDSHSPAFLDLFLSSDTSICSAMAFPLFGNSDHIVSVPFSFHYIRNRMPGFITLFMTILVLNGMVFQIIWEMLHGRISLNSVLLLLVNFLSGFRLELVYISPIKCIRSSLTYLHGFQLILLLP